MIGKEDSLARYSQFSEIYVPGISVPFDFHPWISVIFLLSDSPFGNFRTIFGLSRIPETFQGNFRTISVEWKASLVNDRPG